MNAVGIVVPTRDRPADLARCLAAVAAQAGVGDLDVVVVDDGSRAPDEVADIARGAGAQLVRLDGCGVSAARNAGWRATEADAICFVDDDCEPQAGWAAALARALADGAGVASGPYENGNPGNPFARASHTIMTCLLEGARAAPFFSTANCACARAALTEVGGFDESFGTVGAEDRDFALRVTQAGHELRFVPEAVVLHRADPTPSSFVRQHFRYGRGAFRFQRMHTPARRLEGLGFHRDLARAALGDGLAAAGLVAAAEAAAAAGFAREALAAAIARDTR